MGYKSVVGGKSSKFSMRNRVKTPSGMTGTVIGVAEYYDGWFYNVKLDGRSNVRVKNRRYRENQLRKV